MTEGKVSNLQYTDSIPAGNNRDADKQDPLQPIECLGAIAWEAEKPLDVTTIIVDPPQKGEVRVKVLRPLQAF